MAHILENDYRVWAQCENILLKQCPKKLHKNKQVRRAEHRKHLPRHFFQSLYEFLIKN